ncbi:MAG: hypothetical protein ACOCRK_11005 [bacterium]
MIKTSIDNHNINLLDYFDFDDEKEYFKNIKKNNLGVKVHFNDSTIIKGFLSRWNNYHIFLIHKKNILMINKGQVKMIEPLPALDMLDNNNEKNQ